MYIPYGRQSVSEEDIQAVVNVLRSYYLTTGPSVGEFEKTVAEYVGAKFAVAVANGTAALHIACLAAGIQPGDEVITSPITFAASANCVLYCGGTPVFADVSADTYNINPEEIRKKITPRTKAIIPVHFTGQPCEMDEIRKVSKEYNLLIIEDAAHTIGADYKGKKIGGISDMTIFSFHPVKHITTGEGGMVTTNDGRLYNRLKLFRTHGITRDTDMMLSNEGGWYYEQLELGFNYRITDFQCALGTSQMKRLDQFVARRHEIAKRYDKAFSEITGLITPKQKDGCNNSYHLYVLQTTKVERKEMYDKLQAVRIGVNVHYLPVYKHPYYQKNGYVSVKCTNAEKIYSNFMSLPMYYGLTQEEQEYVIKEVINIATIGG